MRSACSQRIRILITLILWCGVCGFARAASAQESPAETAWNAAVDAFGGRDYERALVAFLAWRETHPSHDKYDESSLYLGRVLYLVRRYGDAVEPLLQAASSELPDPSRQLAAALAAEAAYLAGDETQAAALAEQFETTWPESPRVMTMRVILGKLAFERQRLEEALAIFESALNEMPEAEGRHECKVALGQTLAALGRADDAERHYREVLGETRDPIAAQAAYNLGLLQFTQERLDDAARTLADLLADWPSSPRANESRMMLAWIFYQQNRLEEADHLFRRLQEDAETAVDAGFWRGIIHSQRGDWGQAEAILRQALQAGEGTALEAAIHFRLAFALLHLQRYDEAKQQLDRVYDERNPGAVSNENPLYGLIVWARRARDHAAQDDYSAKFRQYFSNSILMGNVLHMLAHSLMDRERYDAACPLLEQLAEGVPFSELSPTERAEYCDDILKIAVCYSKLGRAEEALNLLAWLEQADAPSRRAQALLERSRMLFEAQRYRDTIEVLENALGVRWRQQRPTLAPNLRGATDHVADAMSWDESELAQGLDLLIRSHLAQGRFDLAKPLHDVYIQRLGDDAPPASFIESVAIAASAAQQTAWAAELRERLAAMSPEARQQTLLKQARTQFESDRYQEAADTLAALLQMDPPREIDTEASMLRAKAVLKTEDPRAKEIALAMYDRIINRYPNTASWAHALFASARYFDEQNIKPQAIKQYRALLQSSVDFPQRDAAMYHLAWDLVETDRRGEARPWFQQIREQYVGSKYWSHATLPLAQWAFQDQQYDHAKNLVEQALSHPADHAIVDRLVYLRAKIALAQGDPAAARASFERLLQEFPSSDLLDAARFGLAEAAFHAKDFVAARAAYEAILTRTAGQTPEMAATVRLRLAQLAQSDTPPRWDETRRLASEARAACPVYAYDYEIDYLLGLSHAMLGEFTKAAELYSAVTQSEAGRSTPTGAKAQLMLADTFVHRGDVETAARHYRQAELLYAMYPEFQAPAMLQLAKCHEALGKRDEARQAYERLIRSFPTSPLAADARARLDALQTNHLR